MLFDITEQGDSRLPTSVDGAGRLDTPLPFRTAGELTLLSDDVDDTSRCSFPASDPPGWSPLRIGPPHD